MAQARNPGGGGAKPVVSLVPFFHLLLRIWCLFHVGFKTNLSLLDFLAEANVTFKSDSSRAP